jgi:hypothetical protein
MFIYPAKYRDRFGEEKTVIQNDGKWLRMILRGIEFAGDDFDFFESLTFTEQQKEIFDFQPVNVVGHFSGNIPEDCREAQILQNYQLECDIPIIVVANDKEREGILRVQFRCRKPLFLELTYDTYKIPSKGKYGDFEEELSGIYHTLPNGAYIKACICCEYADFGPYQGMFGALGCYRGNKDEYHKIKANWAPEKKWALLKIVTEPVQETYLCPEFRLVK